MFPSFSIREAVFVIVHTTAAMETTKPPRKRTFSPANQFTSCIVSQIDVLRRSVGERKSVREGGRERKRERMQRKTRGVSITAPVSSSSSGAGIQVYSTQSVFGH
jgi:hypothetical protein